MLFRIISLILLLISPVFSQNKDPEILLERVKEEFKKIENYKADITVKVDIPFIKMPERNATLYFKQPDKIHIESDGFAMLPKEGINFSPISLFESEHTSFYEKEEMIEDVNAAVIKVIPLNDKSDLVLSTLWIDPIKNLILKVESSRKPTGTFVIEFDYTEMENGLNLPEAIEFTFSVDPLMFRSRNPREMKLDENEQSEDSSNVKTGKVLIYYSNYEVNQGLPDSLFNADK
jgi:outer membrane lipoprotein-sorting protein